MPRVDVYSDRSAKELNAVGLAIFRVWVEWAMGQRALGGHRIRQPTGTYASALRMEAVGKNHISVYVDEQRAPHASILEHGHAPYSMLNYLTPGMRIPMHRTGFVGATDSPFRFAVGQPGPKVQRASRARSSGFLRAGRFVNTMTGVVRVPAEARGSNTSGTGPAWTVPAMPAYAPARHLRDLFARRVAGFGGTITSTR